MLRTHNCGELKISDVSKKVTLCGWIQKSRDLGGMTFIDLRDRYGITQLVFNMDVNAELCGNARNLGREYVIKIKGIVTERSNKNLKMPTGEIEIVVDELNVLNVSKTPPFTIEDISDGGEELRMKYRYLDLRRNVNKENLLLRHKISLETRLYLNDQGFIEIETPCLIKSTPEGARDFIVPSRMNPGEFYALPQSPQTFKQLLMVAGYDRYFQIVRCFRDEDLRADRQPEFTQIDCEMSFVTRDDILETFEGLTRHLFSKVKNINISKFPIMTYHDAMKYYGSDKPDLRFGMRFVEINDLAKGKGFKVFDDAEIVIGICVKACADYSRKQLDELTEFVKKPQIGANGLVYVKFYADGTVGSSISKFYTEEDFQVWRKTFEAETNDLLLILAGDKEKTQNALGALRLEMGSRLGLRKNTDFKPLWVVDFPLLEWDEDTKRFYAKHHPFTSPVPEDIAMFMTDPGNVNANAYDLVINGVEIGGGSIRIHNKDLQKRMFEVLGFTNEEAQTQFGFLMNAFEYGAPPHGGIAFGLDRFCAVFSGSDSIRDFIAFPKNNSGRDIMLDSPSSISVEQLKELNIILDNRK